MFNDNTHCPTVIECRRYLQIQKEIHAVGHVAQAAASPPAKGKDKKAEASPKVGIVLLMLCCVMLCYVETFQKKHWNGKSGKYGITGTKEITYRYTGIRISGIVG